MAKGVKKAKKITPDENLKKIERKKTIVTTAKAKKQQQQQQRQRQRQQQRLQDEAPPHRPSKYVGPTWNRKTKKWQVVITIDGKSKSLGYYHDEKEAARIYDEQAILLGKPVNFPLHEGMEQAVKYAPRLKDASKLPTVNRPTKYVGVVWLKQSWKWQVAITIDGKSKYLGRYEDEKEAARIYDEHAALLGKPVNFPLHEGMKQAVKPAPCRNNMFTVQDVNRPSKYVGLAWHRRNKKWMAKIMIDGKDKFLGYYGDEKEAARVYDEQAALIGKPVNFPLHEGMEQAVKRAPKGAGERKRKRNNRNSQKAE